VHQILEPLFDSEFHDSSHGFRPGRGTRTAIEEATQYLADGFCVTVDIDLSKFFDRVHHQRLLNRLGRRVSDGRVLKLIHRMLKSKVVLPDGTCVTTDEGTPQGGPLSPLLSNVVLDELDQELSRRGLRFVRYADDFSIFVRSLRAGERVMTSIREFITRRLRLVVNEDKSTVSEPYRLTFLGFQFGRDDEGQITIDISTRTRERISRRIRELTPRNWGQSFDRCLEQVNRYLTGWIGYFQIATDPVRRIFQILDAHIRRRLRAILVRQKKRVRHLYRHLKGRGISAGMAWKTCYVLRSPWKRAASFGMHKAYPNDWFAKRLVSLHRRWVQYHAPPSASKQLLLFD
jgi:group II intron reverse transcriptase/maturase